MIKAIIWAQYKNKNNNQSYVWYKVKGKLLKVYKKYCTF